MATTDRPEPSVQPLDKAPDAFRTISEVAEELDLPQHVLRFWETRFAQIKPLKRGGGRRYYRPDDVQLLRGIRRLLYGEGYTIKGVQKILRDQGLRYVASLGRDVPPEATAQPASPHAGAPPAPAGPHLYAPPAERALRAPQRPLASPDVPREVQAPEDPDEIEVDGDDPPGETFAATRWASEESEEVDFDEPEIRIDPLSRPVPTGPLPEAAARSMAREAITPRQDPPIEPRPAPSGLERQVLPPAAPRPPLSAAPPRPFPPQDWGEIGAGEEELEAEEPDAAGASAPLVQVRPEPPKPESPKPDMAKSESPKPEPPRTEPASPPPSFPLAFGPQPLPAESARKLRVLLAELAECRRLLDKAR